MQNLFPGGLSLTVLIVTATTTLAQTEKTTAASKLPPLRVEGNLLKAPDGAVVRLQGVNIASLEWTSQGENVLKSVGVAVNDWGCNVIRLPLSQDRWFGRSQEQEDKGAAYRQLVQQVVGSAAERGCYVVLDQHWSNAGAWGEHIGQHKGEVGCQAGGRDEPAETWAPKVLAYIQQHELNWTAWDFHPSASPCLIRDWNYTPAPHWGALVKAALREAAAKRTGAR